ncbi:MAG: hypothetical protein IPO64_12140 [Bacteroidetes bacterium]|nr:hypothetical protein [Bacteroidota bacterium]
MKAIVFFILFLVLINFTYGVNEIIKIPFIIQHYNDHKANHQDDSVYDFFYKHYIKHQKADSEKDRLADENLPFQSKSTHRILSLVIFFENIRIIKFELITNFSFIPYPKRIFTFVILKFWNPPKN